ncbi:hypothetical protein [Bdellovibrio bacteriovorus]|uniref:hypothetical protein n=1 Tax=Bdellovibrio TaxID=958 RepID=UPI0035A97C8E
MKFVSALVIIFALSFAHAEEKIKWYFNNEELLKIIEIYSKASGQKFVIDPGVRGRVSMFNQEAITVDEAFNQLSSALAINGFAISKQGDTMIVKSARNIQRDLIEVSSEKPSLKPERMYTWVYKAKYVPVANINRDLRILPSKDGEMNISMDTNQIFITDYVSNINRIAKVLEEVDKPLDAATAKLVKASRDEHKARRAERENKKEEKTKPDSH